MATVRPAVERRKDRRVIVARPRDEAWTTGGDPRHPRRMANDPARAARPESGISNSSRGHLAPRAPVPALDAARENAVVSKKESVPPWANPGSSRHAVSGPSLSSAGNRAVERKTALLFGRVNYERMEAAWKPPVQAGAFARGWNVGCAARPCVAEWARSRDAKADRTPRGIDTGPWPAKVPSMPVRPFASEPVSGTQSRALRVLVVEDSPDFRVLLAEELASAGFAVHQAATGGDAIEKARTWEPDVIVLDLMLPDVNGITVAGLVRSYASGAPPSILVVSALTSEGIRHVARAAGTEAFISKPTTAQNVIDEVRRLAGRRFSPGGGGFEGEIGPAPEPLLRGPERPKTKLGPERRPRRAAACGRTQTPPDSQGAAHRGRGRRRHGARRQPAGGGAGAAGCRGARRHRGLESGARTGRGCGLLHRAATAIRVSVGRDRRHALDARRGLAVANAARPGIDVRGVVRVLRRVTGRTSPRTRARQTVGTLEGQTRRRRAELTCAAAGGRGRRRHPAKAHVLLPRERRQRRRCGGGAVARGSAGGEREVRPAAPVGVENGAARSDRLARRRAALHAVAVGVEVDRRRRAARSGHGAAAARALRGARL